MITIRHVPASIDKTMPEYPIPPAWILDGQPEGHGRVIIESADGQLGCGQWKCNPGKFRWEYTVDEFVWLVDGEATISVEGSESITLRKGDTVYFPLGTVAIWNIIRPIHKVFFFRIGQVPSK